MIEEQDPGKGSLASRLNTGVSSIASSEATRNTNNYNPVETSDNDNRFAQEIKQQKIQKDADLKASGVSDDDVNNSARASQYWASIFDGAKKVVGNITDQLTSKSGISDAASSGIAGAIGAGVTKSAIDMLQPTNSTPSGKSVDQIKDTIVSGFNANKALDRAISNGVVRNDDFGNMETLSENLPNMDKNDILDNLKYGLGIEENKLGDKKFSMSLNKDSDYFFYLDKDKDGKDILAKASIKDYNKLVKTGKTVLNAYGTTPFNQGFFREVGAGIANTYSGLAENLVNINRAGSNLLNSVAEDGSKVDQYAKASTDYGKDFDIKNQIQATQPGIGGTAEWIGAGVGQGASSMAQMAIMGSTFGSIGKLIAPEAALSSKFDSVINFGAGSILNFNDAYHSALQAGLSETKAASVGALTGAINGLVESSIGTNRLFNWLSGGGDKTISRTVLKELGSEVTEESLNKVFNNVKKGLTGNAAEFLNKAFEMPVLGEALEEGTEEFLQTYSQKAVENLYDKFVDPDKKVGQGKFGTDFFSKASAQEALESAFFGALLGAGGGGSKFVMDKAMGFKHHTDDSIIPMIADGETDNINAIVKTMHSNKMITDNQKDFYLQRVEQLNNLYKTNTGVFDSLDKQEDQNKSKDLKTQALSIINDSFNLNKQNENLNQKLVALNEDTDAVDKGAQIKELTDQIKNNTLGSKFLNDYVENNFKTQEDGKIPAYEDNYVNQKEIVQNKLQRFTLNEDLKDVTNKIADSDAKITTYESQLDNPTDGQSAKEVRENLEREQRNKAIYENIQNQRNSQIQDLVSHYNEITSESHQSTLRDRIESDKVKQEEESKEPTVTTPIDSVEEVHVESNENTKDDQTNSPVNQKLDLEQQRDQLQKTLDENDDLDPDAINSISDQIDDIESQLHELNKQGSSTQQDFNTYYDETLSRAKAVGKLEDNISEPALSSIKKDIEATITGFSSNGIDTTKLKALHTAISNKLLDIRQTIKNKADEEARIQQEEKDRTKNDDKKLVSNVNFFDRLQRLSFMENDPTYYKDQEVTDIFHNTKIADILANSSLVFMRAEEAGYTPGKVLVPFNSTSSIIVPEIFVSIEYNGKKLGNINQIDGFTSTNTEDFNLDKDQYRNTVVRNTKINALLKERGKLTTEDLTNLGFNMNWSGSFTVNNAVPRTLVKDFPAAKLEQNNGKPYIYDRVHQLEITEGTINMRDNPNVPEIPKDLKERYVVLVQANNGKYYWVGAQNQVLSDISQTNIYNKLMSEVNFLKGTTLDSESVKEHVSKINRYLEDNIFVSKKDANLRLTTPNATNKGYSLELRVKGQKSIRVALDSSKYGTMNDLLSALKLDKTNLRTTLTDNAPAKETINKLSIDLTTDVVTNPLLFKQITVKFDDNKLNDFLINVPIVEQTNTVTPDIEDTTNPFANYETNDNDSDPTLELPEFDLVSSIPGTLTEDQIRERIKQTEADISFSDTSDGRRIGERDLKELNNRLDQITAKNSTIEDLSPFDASYTGLSDDIKQKISLQTAPLLDNFENLSKLQKKGVEVKIREIINSFKPNVGDPVFSIGESPEMIDYPQAKQWIEDNLPKTISVQDVSTMLGNIKNNGVTFGAFANNVIYLNSEAEIGTEYHEAFHAVYRSLLTDKQRLVADNIATKKYGKPSDSELEKLRTSSSVFFDYNKDKLASIWLEEKMANDFKGYSLESNDTSGLGRVFNKIKNLIKYITGNMDQLQSLFYNINRGKFKNADLQSNVYNQYSNQDRVYSIYNKGTDQLGNQITTTQLEGQGIVASLTNKFIQGLLTNGISKTDIESKNNLLDQIIADKAKFYSIDENLYYEEYLNSTGLINNDEFLDQMTKSLEQKRNVFILANNIAALKKDISNNSKIFDLDESKQVDEAQDAIDDIGEQFEKDNWTIGGETSFSKVLRTYISLVTIKTKDEYGQDIEEAVDFKKVYRGLVRALGGVEEANVLPRFKALAEFDEDINAVYDQLLSDTGLTKEGDLDIQNITKGYDLFRKLITAFNNEKVAWYTILHSESQSRLVESNNAGAKDIQFNDWYQDYSIIHETMKHDETLKKIINSNLDFINRSENLIVNTLADAKIKSAEIKSAFNKVGIKLSNAYITYSLLKKSDYTTLDQESKDMLNSFVGTDGLYDKGNIPFIVSEFKSGNNPFEASIDDKGKERGAITRIKDIADQNSLFDPTVGDSSFQNADGKNVYSIIRPSFGLVKLRWLSDPERRQEMLSNDKTKKDDFIDPLDDVKLNHLLADSNIDLIMKSLTPSMIDGYRQTNIAGDTGQKIDEGEGVTFGKFNAQQYMLSDMLMFLSNRKSINSTDETGKISKVASSAMFNINQMEASNTGYGVFLPVNDFKTINTKALNTLFNYLAQEVIRVHKVKSEFGKEDIKTWVGYNDDATKGRGFRLMEFAGYGLDELTNQITNDSKSKEEVYQKLLENKDEIHNLIKTKLEKDIEAYKEALQANGIFSGDTSMLPKIELIKQGYLAEKEKFDINNKQAIINDFYLNSYINTLGINNLLLDNYARKVKNTVGWFKRAKGIIGSGADMGAGITKVGVYEEPLSYIDPKTLNNLDIDKMVEDKKTQLLSDLGEGLDPSSINEELNKFKKDLKKGEIKIADAQSYVTLDHKILQLQRWGRFPAKIEAIFDKIKNGSAITWDEKVELEHNNAALNSTKTVSYNGDYYFKLSELSLTPRLVGEADEKGNVFMGTIKNSEGVDVPFPLKPKEGFEYLYNKYKALIEQGIDQALPLSASKMATISPAKFASDGKFDFSKSTMELENKFKRLQVETPSGKSKITQGTQLIQLIHSEQDDNMPVDFPYNTDVKTLGDLRDTYRQLLADNRLDGFKQALAYIRDPLSGEFNSKELTKKFYNTIVESGADEVLSNFFTPDHNGERQFNWNLGPIVNKAEQLFLAHFSKGVSSQKVPGLKVSLVSDTGIQVKDKTTGKMRSLQHMVKDEDGNYYSECLLPPFANEFMGKDPSDDKIKEVLKMFGVRIPTQDKHSMISLKVVGFLPVEYGSVGVFPKEIVYLSGADFDIDSEFIHRYDFYTDKKGTPIKYGTAITNEGKYEEYIKWNLKNNKQLMSKFKELKASDEIDDSISLDTLNDFMDFTENKVREAQIKNAFASLGLPSTLDDFIKQNPTNVGTNNNALLLAQIKFLTNDYVRDRAATIPSSMSSIEKVRETVESALKLTNQDPVSPNTPLARFNANRNNMEGKQGIGPVALANITHSLLSSSNVEFFKGLNLPEISGKKSTGFQGIYTIESETDRKNDNISTLLSAMTDNAKEQHAKILNLSFNGLPTDTLPVASYLLSSGYTMEEAILFLNQPGIKAYTTGDFKLNNTLDTLRAFDEKQVVEPLTIENLVNMLNIDNIDKSQIKTQDDILNQFLGLQQQAKYTQNISALLSLNKGLKSTFDDNLRLDKVLRSLQLGFLQDNIKNDTFSYKDLINNLVNNNIVKVVNNKVIAGDNFPSFKPDTKNTNNTPFDARLALLNDPNTIQNVIIHSQVMDASKQFFLLNTKVFKSMTSMLSVNSKDVVPFFMDRANKSFLEEVYPDKYQKLMEASDNGAYMIYKSGANSIGRDLYNLKKDPDFRNNILVKLLTLKEPRVGSSIVQIEFPTRIKAEGDLYTNLNNAFKELFMNPKTTDFARKLYYYSYFKDGLQFKNKSFINTIPSWVFKDVSSSLDVLNDDFKDDNIDNYSALKEGVLPTVVDMLTSFSRVESLASKLPKTKYDFTEAFKSNLDKTDKSLVTTSLLQTEGINFSTLDSYLASLKVLSKDESNKNANKFAELYANDGKLVFDPVSYFNQSSEDPTAQQTVSTKTVQSVKGFDYNGSPVFLDINGVVDHFLRYGEYPTIYEATFKNAVPALKESALNSTVIDNKFIDNMIAIKQSISKDISKQDNYTTNEVLNNTLPETDEATIGEQQSNSLDNSDKSSNFVNPFGEITDKDQGDPSIEDKSFVDYNNDLDQINYQSDINDELDSNVDKFLDDNNNPIC